MDLKFLENNYSFEHHYIQYVMWNIERDLTAKNCILG